MTDSALKRRAASVAAPLSLGWMLYDGFTNAKEYIQIFHEDIYFTLGPLLLAMFVFMRAMSVLWPVTKD